MKAVEVDGAVLATESFGSATRGTLILVMGATASMVWWPTGFCETLTAGGYQVIRFDHRDTGASTTAAPGDLRYGLDDLANDLVGIMDAYEIPSAHIIGMSLGALAAQLLAVRQPKLVRSLTLIAAEPLGLTYEAEGIAPAFLEHFGSMATLDWSVHEAVTRFMLTIAELSAGSALPFDRAATLERVKLELARTSNMQSAFNHAGVTGELPPDVNAGAIEVPVLIVHGTEDPIISVKAAERAVGALPDARQVLLAGRGHELAPADLGRIAAEISAHVATADALSEN